MSPVVPTVSPLERVLTEALRPHLHPRLLTGSYRAAWSDANPTAGFCSIAAEAAYFILGGPTNGWTAVVGRDPNGGTHWWLERGRGTPEWERLDPTADQYHSVGRTPPYAAGRPGGFMGQRHESGNPFGFDRRPGRRAAALLTEWAAALGHDRLDAAAVAALRSLVQAPSDPARRHGPRP